MEFCAVILKVLFFLKYESDGKPWNPFHIPDDTKAYLRTDEMITINMSLEIWEYGSYIYKIHRTSRHIQNSQSMSLYLCMRWSPLTLCPFLEFIHRFLPCFIINLIMCCYLNRPCLTYHSQVFKITLVFVKDFSRPRNVICILRPNSLHTFNI